MLNNDELMEVRGGAFSASLLNSVSRLIGTMLEIGRTVGSSLRRVISKKYCSIN